MHAFTKCNIGFMYAYDDWALSVVAAAAGEADVRNAFVARSKNYRFVSRCSRSKGFVTFRCRNVWDSHTEFMCPRNSSGAFECSFDPSMPFIADKHYTEGNAWQWTWAVGEVWVHIRFSRHVTAAPLRCPAILWVSSVSLLLPSDFANACTSSCCEARCIPGPLPVPQNNTLSL